MTTPHRKQARLLLILFLVLYAAFTLLPVGVWAVYRLGHSPDGATSSGETASPPQAKAPFPGQLPKTRPVPWKKRSLWVPARPLLPQPRRDF